MYTDFFVFQRYSVLQWYYSISGIRVNVYNKCKHGSHICNHGFIFLGAQKNRLIDTALLSMILFFVFQRYKLYNGIIYYDERSLLLSGSYSGCMYRFHFCVSNIKALHRYHFL